MRQKINSLTSLRFFAATLIVLWHGTVFFKYPLPIFDARNAVSFFFVLSGFILVYSYGDINPRNDFRYFLAARISRLWPAYIVTAVVAALTVSPVGSVYDVVRAFVNATMLQSLVPLRDFYYSFDGVEWSVSAEMLFYLVFPFALILLRRNLLWLVCSAAFVSSFWLLVSTKFRLSVSETENFSAWGILYISPLCRISDFFIGMAACSTANKVKPFIEKRGIYTATWLELGVLIVMVCGSVFTAWLSRVVFSQSFPQVSIWVLTTGPTFLFALALVVMFANAGAVSKVLSIRPLIYLGEISFSLYLVHQLVVRIMFAYAGGWARENLLVASGLYWIVSLAAAALIYEFIERPWRAPLRNLLNGRNVIGGEPRSA